MDISREIRIIKQTDGKDKEVVVFVETVTTQQSREISLDYLDSQITHRENTIIGLNEEIKALKEKKEFILSL